MSFWSRMCVIPLLAILGLVLVAAGSSWAAAGPGGCDGDTGIDATVQPTVQGEDNQGDPDDYDLTYGEPDESPTLIYEPLVRVIAMAFWTLVN